MKKIVLFSYFESHFSEYFSEYCIISDLVFSILALDNPVFAAKWKSKVESGAGSLYGIHTGTNKVEY